VKELYEAHHLVSDKNNSHGDSRMFTCSSCIDCIEKPLAPVLAASTVSIGSIPLVDITEYFSEYAQKPASNLVVNGTAGMYDYVNTQSTQSKASRCRR